MAKGYPTLAQLANTYVRLAVAAAPRRKVNGGNLKTQLQAYNRPAGVIKQTKGSLGYSLVLDVAPPNARYGKFWNDPNVSWQVRTQKTGNNASINFAIKARDSVELTNLINEYNKNIIDENMGILIKGTLDKSFKKLSSIK